MLCVCVYTYYTYTVTKIYKSPGPVKRSFKHSFNCSNLNEESSAAAVIEATFVRCPDIGEAAWWKCVRVERKAELPEYCSKPKYTLCYIYIYILYTSSYYRNNRNSSDTFHRISSICLKNVRSAILDSPHLNRSPSWLLSFGRRVER